MREQITLEALFGASTHDDRVSSFESGGLSRWSHGPLWIVMDLVFIVMSWLAVTDAEFQNPEGTVLMRLVIKQLMDKASME